jgi:hypothetical protein
VIGALVDGVPGGLGVDGVFERRVLHSGLQPCRAAGFAEADPADVDACNRVQPSAFE